MNDDWSRELLELELEVHRAAIERNNIAIAVNGQIAAVNDALLSGRKHDGAWQADVDARSAEMLHAQAYRDYCRERDAATDARYEREVVALERIAHLLEGDVRP